MGNVTYFFFPKFIQHHPALILRQILEIIIMHGMRCLDQRHLMTFTGIVCSNRTSGIARSYNCYSHIPLLHHASKEKICLRKSFIIQCCSRRECHFPKSDSLLCQVQIHSDKWKSLSERLLPVPQVWEAQSLPVHFSNLC